MTVVDYSSPIAVLDENTLTSVSFSTIQDYINKGNPAVTPKYYVTNGDRILNPEWDPIDISYNLGTTDILNYLETMNILLCFVIFIMMILVFLVSFYIIQNRFKLDRR